ncbi:ARID DNA-binding domain-containing protein [Tanacetum coccineum]
MSNYKGLLQKNWLQYDPVQQCLFRIIRLWRSTGVEFKENQKPPKSLFIETPLKLIYRGPVYTIQFYLVYLRRDVLEPLPLIIERVKIDLLGLYKMVDSMGGYLSVSLGNKWKDEASKYEETKEVEIGCDQAKEGNPQEHVGLSKSGLRVVKDNTSGRFKNVQGGETHFGVILEGDNETDDDQVTDQKDGGNTSENDDFVVITMEKEKGCDVKTESMIAKQNKYLEEYFDSIDPKDACPLIKGLEELKWNRNMVQDYLDDDYISVNGTLYAIKVNSFQRFISFLDLIKGDKLVYENWNILSKRFEDMLKWFYLVYLRWDVLEPLPLIIERVKIDLLGLYKMVDSMGGCLSVSLGNKWKDVATIHGLPKEHDEDLKECYKRTIDLVKCYYETTLRAWYKEGLVKYEETKEVEIGCDHAKEGNPQEHVGSSKSGLRVVKDNTSGRFKNVQGGETHFGVILEGDNETDDDHVTDQKDGGNTSENDDFVVIT